MRIAGWILLLIGLLLCVSVVWATLGFLLMGVGLVSLQVAERNRRRVQRAAAADVEYLDTPLKALAAPPTIEPVFRPEPVLAPAREAARRADPARPRYRQRHDNSDPSYDREAWQYLIERDPDLAQLAAVLADYGQPYVDELASRYLADPDNSRLGEIVDGIIAKASGDVALPATTRPWIVPVQVPEVAIPRNPPELTDSTAPRASSMPLTEAEVSVIGAIAASAEARVEPPSNPEGTHKPITAADDELTEMIRRLGPASDIPR